MEPPGFLGHPLHCELPKPIAMLQGPRQAAHWYLEHHPTSNQSNLIYPLMRPAPLPYCHNYSPLRLIVPDQSFDSSGLSSWRLWSSASLSSKLSSGSHVASSSGYPVHSVRYSRLPVPFAFRHRKIFSTSYRGSSIPSSSTWV